MFTIPSFSPTFLCLYSPVPLSCRGVRSLYPPFQSPIHCSKLLFPVPPPSETSWPQGDCSSLLSHVSSILFPCISSYPTSLCRFSAFQPDVIDSLVLCECSTLDPHVHSPCALFHPCSIFLGPLLTVPSYCFNYFSPCSVLRVSWLSFGVPS